MDNLEEKKNNHLQILMFKVKSENEEQCFGVNIFKIQEIQSFTEAINMQNNMPEILGVIKSRDEFIPLLDACQILMGKKSSENKNLINMICHNSNVKFGIQVQEVSTIFDTSWDKVKEVDSSGYAANSYIIGFVEFEDKLIQLLNLDELVFNYIKPKEVVEVKQIENKSLKDKKILVIDDSKSAQKIIEEGLKKNQMLYTGELDANKALSRLKSNEKIDLILCDIEMPGMNGYSFLSAAKELKSQGVKVPHIIMYSSLCDEVSMDKAFELGASFYITKYDMNKILFSIEEFVSSI